MPHILPAAREGSRNAQVLGSSIMQLCANGSPLVITRGVD